MKGGRNKINKNVIAVVFLRKLSANIEEIVTSSQDAASFIYFFLNKLSHKQFSFFYGTIWVFLHGYIKFLNHLILNKPIMPVFITVVYMHNKLNLKSN